MKIENHKIGTDPELFIIDKSRDKIISSIGLIPGTKWDKYTDGLSDGYGLQTDNILAEFNVPPSVDKKEFINSIMIMKEYIRDYVKRSNPHLDILCTGSRFIDMDQLMSREAREFGCSVDFNAWTDMPNPKPRGNRTNLRTAGCHIHVGYDNPSKETSLELIKAMDLFLGIPSVIIDPDKDRRKLYGNAGCHRLTGYGCEYRVLSGLFIENEDLIGYCFDQTNSAVDFINQGGKIKHGDDIIQAINESDEGIAMELINYYNIKLAA